MKTAIIGAKGQLGTDCREIFATNQLICADLPELDATNRQTLFSFLDSAKPELILNCAAYTAVDRCETDKETGWKINRDIPLYLSQWCQKNNAFLIHISTDYVLSGNKPLHQASTETEPTGPVSEYGRSKLAGDQAIQTSGMQHYAILRTAWLYSAHGNNFLKTMLKFARQGRALNVVNDQFGSPTWSHTLARQMKAIAESRITGIFNATSEGYCTWYQLACTFLKQLDQPYTITPCTTAEYPTPARRPANSILENARLKAEGLNLFENWETELERFIQNHGTTLIREIDAALTAHSLA